MSKKGQNRIVFGYVRNAHGKFVEYPEQAIVVKLIFGNGTSLADIGKALKEQYHYFSPTNKPDWNRQTIINILSNEKYIGDVLLQKTYIKDFFLANQVKNNGQLPQYFLEGSHAPIISKQDYDLLKKSVIRYTYGSILNEQDKEDLIQIIMLKALTYLKSYNGQYCFWTWIKRIMKHEFYRMLKRKSGENQYLEDNETIINELLFEKRNDIDVWASNQRAKEWLEILSPKEREVVVRYLFRGEMQIDIGVEKHVTKAAVSRWYRNALRKLRGYLMKICTHAFKHELDFRNTDDKAHGVDC